MPQNKNETVIRIANLSLRFGGLQALDDIDLEVRAAEILAIIGPNGAGKTCVLNCINGFYHPYQGEIIYQDRDLTGLKPHKIATLGIARTFQNIELYSKSGRFTSIWSEKKGGHGTGSVYGPDCSSLR
jgi:branched-chain amino acid transport system ATP-binding protein